MPNLDLLNNWIRTFEDVQKIEEFDDLTSEFTRLRLKVERKRELTDDDDKRFENIIKIHWQRVLKSKYDEIESDIKGRNTESQNFNSNLKQIRKIRRKAEEHLDIDEYYELFIDLKKIRRDVDTNILIDKHQKRESHKMLVFAFFLGVLSTLICGIALAYYFNYFPIT